MPRVILFVFALAAGCFSGAPQPEPPAAAASATPEASPPAPAAAPASTPDGAPSSPDAAPAPPASAQVIIPAKSDPECQQKGTPLGSSEEDALLRAYLDIQQRYLQEKKGATALALAPVAGDPRAYELTFNDMFGAQGKMRYRFGAAISNNGKVTLCLDEGDKLLWAGTYRREGKSFVPDM